MRRTAIAACLGLAWVLSGCAASKPHELLLASCPAARDVPSEPAEVLEPGETPGAVVRAAIVNRSAWIEHSRDLGRRLGSCK